MGSVKPISDLRRVDGEILKLLGHRYADGLVYFGEVGERPVFERAVRLGLISREGYLTRDGRTAVARYALE